LGGGKVGGKYYTNFYDIKKKLNEKIIILKILRSKLMGIFFIPTLKRLSIT
jgi:hypothetical protein